MNYSPINMFQIKYRILFTWYIEVDMDLLGLCVDMPCLLRVPWWQNFIPHLMEVFIPRRVAEGGYCYHPGHPSGWLGINIYSCECNNS